MRAKLCFFVVLAIALLVVFLVSVSHPTSEWSVGWTLGLLVTSPLWMAAIRSVARWLARQDLFSPLIAYPLAYVAWFILGSVDFVQLPSWMSFGAFEPIPWKIPFYAAIGLVAYFCGVVLCLRESGANNIPVFCMRWQPARFRSALTALAAVIVGGYCYITAFMGVPILHLSALSEARPETDKIPLYHWVATPFWDAAYTVFFLLLVKLWMGSGLSKGNSRFSLWTGLSVLLLLFASFGARAAFVPPLLTSLILYHYLKKRLRIRNVTIVAVALFILLSAYGFLRDVSGREEFTDVLADAGVPRISQPMIYVYLYFRYTVATFRDVAEVIPAHVPYQHGAITSLPLQALLPGHHETSDFYFKNLLGNDFVGQGQPATVLGPFYADFGEVGIFVGMFAWGLLLAKLYRWMLRDETVFSALIYAWTAQAGLFGLFGGMFGYIDTLLIPLSWVVLDFLMRDTALERNSPTAAVRFAN